MRSTSGTTSAWTRSSRTGSLELKVRAFGVCGVFRVFGFLGFLGFRVLGFRVLGFLGLGFFWV